MMKTKDIRLTMPILFVLSILLMLMVIGYYFPYTGLKAIIIIPFIVFVTSVAAFLSFKLIRNVTSTLFSISWFLMWVLCFYLTLVLFPQEYRPSVIRQIFFTYSSIQDCQNVSISDLDLPFKVDDFGRKNCSIQNSQERYVIALYKFRNKLPMDGSFNIYREDKTNGIVSNQTIVRNIEDIPKKLKTNQEKLIWKILEDCR